MRPSSFDFLKGTPYQPALRHLENFERQFILNPVNAGNSLRSFWEKFSEIAIEATNLNKTYQEYLESHSSNGKPETNTMGSRMRFLDQRFEFRTNGIKLTHEFSYRDHRGNTHTEQRFEPGYKWQSWDLYPLNYFRFYAHAFHHVDVSAYNGPKYNITFRHTHDYIQNLQAYLIDFLKLKNIKPTNFLDMPLYINNGQTVFYLEHPLVLGPLNQLQDCYTYSGVMYPNKDQPSAYPAIIQLFDKHNTALNVEQLQRSATTYATTRRSKFGEALRDIRVLSGYHTNAEFYILAYIFETPAQPLTELLLKEIGISDRLILCREISRIVSKLHNAQPAIYHRLLNHRCIYLCQNIEKDILWYPSIVGFSFSKIDNSNHNTAFANYNQINKLKYSDTQIYIPINWEDSAANYGDMVDIYSMGMLFFHILTGRFNHNITVNANKPVQKHFTTIRSTLGKMLPEAAELIVQMLNPLGAMRPSAEEVFERLDQLCK